MMQAKQARICDHPDIITAMCKAFVMGSDNRVKTARIPVLSFSRNHPKPLCFVVTPCLTASGSTQQLPASIKQVLWPAIYV